MLIVVAIQIHFFQKDFVSRLLLSSLLSVALLSIFHIPSKAQEQILKTLSRNFYQQVLFLLTFHINVFFFLGSRIMGKQTGS